MKPNRRSGHFYAAMFWLMPVVVARAQYQPPGTVESPPGVPCDCESNRGSLGEDLTRSVNLWSGEFVERAVDLRVKGRGLDFIWARTYHSRSETETQQGYGWDFSYNIRLIQDGAQYAITDGNGRRDVYTFDPGSGSYVNNQLFRQLFVAGPQGRLVFADRGEWRFRPLLPGDPAAGKIQSIVDRNGNMLQFDYDPIGRLFAVIDTLGRPFTVAYNPDGFIESITDFTGRVVRYNYYTAGDIEGDAGDLKSVTTPAVVGTTTGNDFPAGKTITYTYSKGLPDFRLNHNLLTITNPAGAVYLRNTYSPNPLPSDFQFDHVVRQAWGDPDDLIDLFYLPQIPSISNNFAVVRTIVNDRVGNVKEAYFNGQNQGVMLQEYTGRANPDLPTTDVLNRPGPRLRPTDPPFFATRYQYNPNGLATQIGDPNGNTEQFLYDSGNPSPRSRGNLLVHSWQPGPLGGAQPVITESFQYDPAQNADTNQPTIHLDGKGQATQFIYAPTGNRTRTIHRDGAIDDYDYNAFGQMTLHVLPDNGSGHRRRDVTTYYAAGLQTGYKQNEIVDADGFAITTTYEYDALGRVIRTVDPRGFDAVTEFNALDQVVRSGSRLVDGVRYETLSIYDANNNVVRVDVSNQDENGVLEPNAFWTTIYEYDALGNKIRQCQEKIGADVPPGVVHCADLDATAFVTTEYSYSDNGLPFRVRSGEAVNGHQPANTLTTLYDERDLVFRVINAEGSTLQSSAQFDYDGNRSVVRQVVGLESIAPRETRNVYDGYDRLVRSVDAMGNETEYDYDANHNLVVVQTFGEPIDLPGSAGNTLLAETQTVYDPMDRSVLASSLHFDDLGIPVGDGSSTTSTVYSPCGQILATLDDAEHATRTTYDTANRVSMVTDPRGNRIIYGYDQASNVLSVTETDVSDLGSPVESFVSTNTYDELGRLSTTTDNAGHLSVYDYDSRNNRTRVVDAAGNETRSVYDGCGNQKISIRDMDGDGANGSPADVVIQSTYDDNNRRRTEVDDNGRTTTYAYDLLDRRIQTLQADSTSSSVIYNVFSEAVQTTDANGSVVVIEHDAMGRILHKEITPGPGVSNETTFETFMFDGLGRLVYAEDDDSVVTQAYDSLSRVVRETLNGVATNSTWDAMGNKTLILYPGGTRVDLSYDPLNRLQTAFRDFVPVGQYFYRGASRVERLNFGNGTILSSEFGLQREITRTLHQGPLGVIDDRVYTYDAMGNKKSRRDQTPGTLDLLHTMTYDRASRMTHVRVTDPGNNVLRDTNYDLDGAGNRLDVLGGLGAGPYHMDPAPVPADAQVNQYTQTPFDDRTYDNNGNLISISFGSGSGACPVPGDLTGDSVVNLADVPDFVTSLLSNDGNACVDLNGDGQNDGQDIQGFVDAIVGGSPPTSEIQITFNYRNEMVAVTGPLFDGSSLVNYRYDALGRRIETSKSAGGRGGSTTTSYFYDGWQEIEERNQDGVTVAVNVYGNYVDEILVSRRNGADLFYHTDDLFNVVAVTDAGGNVIERYEYGDYGLPLNASTLTPLTASLVQNPYYFQGRRFDPETGWYYYRMRYLDPLTGRYISRAAIGIFGDVFGNNFAFVGNNPWTWLDPLGNGVVYYRYWWWSWYRYQWWAWWTPYGWSGYYCYYWWWWYPYRYWLWWWYPYRWIGYCYWWWSPYWKYGWWPYRWCWWPYRWYWWWQPYRWWGYHYGWYWWWYSWRCWVWYPYGSSWWWWWYPHGWCGWYGWYWNWWHPWRWWWYGYWWCPGGWWGCGYWWYWHWPYRWYWSWYHWYWWPCGWHWYPCGWWGCWWGWHLWWYPTRWWWWNCWWYPYWWWGWNYSWYWWWYPYAWYWWWYPTYWWWWYLYGWYPWYYGWYWNWYWGYWIGWWWWWPATRYWSWWRWGWPWIW